MDYTFLKINIRNLYNKCNYAKCNLILKNLLVCILQDMLLDGYERNSLIWFYYFYKSNIEKRNGNYKDSLLLCNKSLEFVEEDEKDCYNYKYLSSLFLLGKIHEDKGSISKSIKQYEKILSILNNKKHKEKMLLLYLINKLSNNSRFKEIEANYNKIFKNSIQESLNFYCYF
ncbi:hypothetical protein [Clostridium rectalis]|uniref:hypothetical protein n=1 Tax=Clostridium rectalis TaxID=2040295 RepID=UPI000F63F30B|nr:hypothetical protein [Clostridium rectalis]